VLRASFIGEIENDFSSILSQLHQWDVVAANIVLWVKSAESGLAQGSILAPQPRASRHVLSQRRNWDAQHAIVKLNLISSFT
jgi:hypothetical protein